MPKNAVKKPVWQYTDAYLDTHALSPIPIAENATAGTQYAAIHQPHLKNFYKNKSDKGTVNTTRPKEVVAYPGRGVNTNSLLDTYDKAVSGQTGERTGSGNVSYSSNSPYLTQLNELYDQIMNRKPFQYDLNGDLLYRQMADQYTQLGLQASRDAMGQAAALTGGYGNSYATQVGNQANQQYLTALNQTVPDLYQQALNAYIAEGDRMLQRYELAAAHPGVVRSLSPQPTVTAGTGDDDLLAYAQALQGLTYNGGTLNANQPENALDNWYYRLLNAQK